MEKTYEFYIKTTPPRLWHAITDTDQRRQYTFGLIVASDWTQGSRYLGTGRGTPVLEGENQQVDPPHRLVQTFRALWSPEVAAEPQSRVTWAITPIEDSCQLIVTHDQLRDNANPQLYGGWPMVLCGLKTLLETGETLTTPGSLQWAEPSS